MDYRPKEKAGGYCSNSGEEKMVAGTRVVTQQAARSKSSCFYAWRVEVINPSVDQTSCAKTPGRNMLASFSTSLIENLSLHFSVCLILFNKTKLKLCILLDRCLGSLICVRSHLLSSAYI